MVQLTDLEARILGSLLEKQVTTPEYYPMSLNSLVAACNQKNNRDPIVEYDDRTVVRGLDGLREKKLIWMVHSSGSRVPKYEHRLQEMFVMPSSELAVMCLLLLRGPQTAGELRNRSGRLHQFATIAEVETVLYQLSVRCDGPLVVKLPLLPRTHEPRFAHLLCGEPVLAPVEVAPPPVETARAAVEAENAKLARLEEEVAALRAEVAELQQRFAGFRQQFE